MKIVALNCNECGASLDVGTKTRFVTCSFCATKLQIHHSGNGHFSEALQAMEKKTDALQDEVSMLRQQGELEALDREWVIERQSYMIQQDNGQSTVPTLAGSVAAALLGSAFGIFWVAFVRGFPQPGSHFAYVGLAFIAASCFAGFHGARMANKYAQAKRRYQRRRLQLTSAASGSR